MANDLVDIASFMNPVLAQIVRGRLEASGIDCWLANDTIFGIHPGHAWVDGGVKLRVRECDAERAIELLKLVEEDSTSSIDEDTFPKDGFLVIENEDPEENS